MPPPIPRCSNWAYSSLNSPSCFSLPRYGSRVRLPLFLFEACSTFTRVAACTLALSPIRDTLIEGFSHFVTSMTAPIASGWSDCRVGLSPTGKRRLCTAHATSGHSCIAPFGHQWLIIQGRAVGKLLAPLLVCFTRRDGLVEQQPQPGPWEALYSAGVFGACELRSLVAMAFRLSDGMQKKFGAVRI